MFITKNRKIWYMISGFFVVVSLFSLFRFGLKAGLDFTGGSLLEVEYKNSRPAMADLQEKVNNLNMGSVILQPSGDKTLTARLKGATEEGHITEEEHKKLSEALSAGGNIMTELRFDSVGPVVGTELRQKSWIAVTMVVVMIILYITFVFRKVSHPVSSFKYGLMAVAALVHDVTVPAGVFAILGHYKGVEVDLLFVTALLTILGFSVHDTIVVFDRIRENLRKGIGDNFEETVGYSVDETLTRSVNTSLTVLLVVIAMYLFGGETTKYFSLVLTIGLFFGTYSSIFLASPFLITAYKFQKKGKK